MEVLGTGMSGLVGTRVIELLPHVKFRNLSLETGFDITDKDSVGKIVSAAREPVILHMAAYTDVDGAEKEKVKGRASLPWIVNVEGTRNLAQAAARFNKKLIYISTDYVFRGDQEFYTENDQPDPVSWYGLTKYEGEKCVASILADPVIVRIAYPYRSAWEGRPDFVHRIISQMKMKKSIQAVDDQMITPTFIDNIATALGYIISHDIKGILHVTGSGGLSPYAAAEMIAQTFRITARRIIPVSAEEYFRGRAARPLHAVLKNVTMAGSGLKLVAFADGLKEVYRQEHPEG
jgi:dTDP-4-dehydrorhamnose reductase